MIKNNKIKRVSVALLFIMLFQIFANLFSVAAASIGESKYLSRGSKSDYVVQYNAGSYWVYLSSNIVTYQDETETNRVAYCVVPGVPGIEWVTNNSAGYSVNLTKTLEDVRVWRVIRFGYPYVSAASLGVENDDDAYLATKLAIQCILQNRPLSEIRTFYRGGQDPVAGMNLADITRRGNKVVDAVYNLANKGYNGTETPASNNIVGITKVGEFKIDSNTNYFSQTYKVTSQVEMSNYTITSLLNFPEGSFSADLNGNAKTTFSSGEQFKVMIPKNKITSNINGEVLIQTKCKTYPILYGEGPSGWQDYAVCVDPYGDVTAETTLNAVVNNGEILINKIDGDTSKPVEGVTFELTTADGTKVGRATTDKNGKATFSSLFAGNYKLKEVSANQHYVINNKVFDVKVEVGKTTTLDVSNYKKKGQVRVIKVDKDNKEVKLKDVEFQVIDENGRVLETLKTDSNGEAVTKEYALKDYAKLTIKETKTGNDYILNETPQTVTLKESEIVNVTFTNELKKGKIKVVKIDLDNKEVKIPNVEFKVYDESDKVIDTLKTDSNGEATSIDLPINQNYKVQETKTGEWYVLNEIPQTAVLKQDQITTLTFTNEKKKGQVKVIKVDEDHNEVKLKDVEFKIYDQKGNEVQTLKTDSNGEATSKKLPIDQTYTVKETKTQSTYILSKTPQTVILKENQITNLTFTNKKKEGNLKLFKVDKDNNKITLGNVEFDLLSKEFNKIIGTYKTDVNGEIEVKNLRVGNYTWIEKITNKFYSLAKDTQVEVEWKNTTETTVENELKKGQVKIIKVDKDNNEVKLANIKFEVLDENNNVLETVVTNKDGEAFTKEYPVRDYEKLIIKEVETQENYVLNKVPQTIVLEENQIKTITFENELKKAKIKVIKTDVDTKVTLKNVEFDVIDNTTKKVVDHIKTNEEGIATTKDLRIDHTYSVKETKTQEIYKLNKEITNVDLTKYIKDYKENIVEKVDITNEKKKGQVEVFKVDSENKEYKLERVEFEVINSDNEVVEKIITDKDGKATTSRLPIGEYTLKEVKTDVKHVLNDKVIKVDVTEDIVKKLEITNDRVKGYVEITKVSSNDNELTGEVKGTKLENAEFEIYKEENDELVDTLKTDKEGKATSKLLDYGRYYIVEKNTGSDYYLLNTARYIVEITENKVTVPITIENDSVEVGLDIDKNGIEQAQANDEIKYSFNSLKNTSNVALDNFTWTDNLPYDYVRITKLFTGTYNEDLDYIVKYKTNKSEDYIEYGKFNTQKNNYIDFTKVELAEDEFITDFKVEFGTVMPGFEAVEKPFIFCKVLPTVKAEDKWTNRTSLTGNYKEHKLEDKAEWTTKSYAKKLTIKKLPKTGF